MTRLRTPLLTLALMLALPGCVSSPHVPQADPVQPARATTTPGAVANSCDDAFNDGTARGWDISTVSISRTHSSFSYTFTARNFAVGAGEAIENTWAQITIGDPDRGQPYLPLTTFFGGNGTYRVSAWSDQRGDFRVAAQVTGDTSSFTTSVPISVLEESGIETNFEWRADVHYDSIIRDGCPDNDNGWLTSNF